MKVRGTDDATSADTAALVMTAEPVVVHPDDPLDEAAMRMQRYEIRHLPVVNEEGSVVGMLSDRDLRLAGRQVSTARVRAAMTPSAIVVAPDTPVDEVARIMADERISAVPVVAENRLVGIVSYVDLLYAWHDGGEGVRLDLSEEDAGFLLAQLKRHTAEVEDELVHTDTRVMQHDLASDLARIRKIAEQLERRLSLKH